MKKTLFYCVMTLMMSAYAQANNNPSTYFTPNDSVKKLTHTLTIEGGPSSITSKVYSPDKTYSWRTGFEWGAELTFLNQKGIGVGLAYMHNLTHYPDDKLIFDYIGASFVISRDFANRWRYKASLGAGYSHYKDKYKNVSGYWFENPPTGSEEDGIGTRIAFGVEYLLTNRFGIGATLQNQTIFMNDQSTSWLGKPKNSKNGFTRWGVNMTLNYYF